MKILKAGKPQPAFKTEFIGTCKVCGAEVSIHMMEAVVISTESIFKTKDRLSVRCPTVGCKGSIETEY